MAQNENADPVPSSHHMVPEALVRDMLASLQEAVVSADPDHRRALLKGVIGHLQDVLATDTPR